MGSGRGISGTRRTGGIGIGTTIAVITVVEIDTRTIDTDGEAARRVESVGEVEANTIRTRPDDPSRLHPGTGLRPLPLLLPGTQCIRPLPHPLCLLAFEPPSPRPRV